MRSRETMDAQDNVEVDEPALARRRRALSPGPSPDAQGRGAVSTGRPRTSMRSDCAADAQFGRQLISPKGDVGAVLLEVIVAMVLLASAGLAAVSMAAEAAGAVSRARQAEVRTEQGSRFMDAVSLWTRADLDRRLGDRRQGPFILRLERPDPELYTAALADSATGHVLLSTSLFRRDTADALP